MRTFTLSHLSDDVLMGNLTTLVARERGTTATLLAHLAEVDSRRLFTPAGFPSMYAWCVESLHLSEDAAYKRIQAARIARKFPALFDALADGRIHMTAVLVLAPHLTSGNVDALIELATHRTRVEIELALARRFPRPEIQRLDDGISALGRVELAPGRVDGVGQLAPERVAAPPTRVAPLSPERFALQVTIGQATHDKLRYAQSLLGVASGDVAPVLERALDALIGQLEKRKLGSTKRPLRTPRPSTGRRTVPAHVRREVWERDGGQCTFMGKTAGSARLASSSSSITSTRSPAADGRRSIGSVSGVAPITSTRPNERLALDSWRRSAGSRS